MTPLDGTYEVVAAYDERGHERSLEVQSYPSTFVITIGSGRVRVDGPCNRLNPDADGPVTVDRGGVTFPPGASQTAAGCGPILEAMDAFVFGHFSATAASFTESPAGRVVLSFPDGSRLELRRKTEATSPDAPTSS